MTNFSTGPGIESARSVCVTVILCASVGGCLLPGGGSGGAVGGQMLSGAEAQPLRRAGAARHKRVGAALMSRELADAQLATLVARQFDSLTPENEMKWETVEAQPGVFSFAAGDKLVAFAATHDMRMRGHTLIWHAQLAPWVKRLSGEALRDAMTRHIQNVVGHWKGKIGEWDVVNEALADGPGGRLRTDSPWLSLGPAYVEEAFRLAHEADPQALLFYNDYEIERPGSAKAEAAFALCKHLKEAGVPIHGIGMQMHIDPRHWPTADQIRQNLERYAALGLFVELTEMDVPVGELPGSIDEKLNRQRAITHDIVAACVAVERCSGITFWGVSDRASWLNSPQWGQLRGRGPHYPLPFNADLRPKPMVAGIVDALSGR
jgi:endo-1,4-beta-xylanase